MLTHPQFNPVAFQIASFAVSWYGLMYLLAFAGFLWLGRVRIRRGFCPGWKVEELDDLLLYGVLGVIVGGRLGYVFFYKPDYYLAHPEEVFRVWLGGMSFHGGLLGVVLAVLVYAHRSGRRFLQITDFIAPLVPLGIVCGRLGNFINGELWGRPSRPDALWSMLFPQSRPADALLAQSDPGLLVILNQHGALPRHASQLYELLLEGLLLFVLLWRHAGRLRPVGQVSALFLLGYGVFRFAVEFVREPDALAGALTLGLSVGQWQKFDWLLRHRHLLPHQPQQFNGKTGSFLAAILVVDGWILLTQKG
jgi:phosphatidylglycerol:prolipoprotein diacylglycerol transferase